MDIRGGVRDVFACVFVFREWRLIEFVDLSLNLRKSGVAIGVDCVIDSDLVVLVLFGIGFWRVLG